MCIRPCARVGLALTPASQLRSCVDKVRNADTLTVGRTVQALGKTGSWLPGGKAGALFTAVLYDYIDTQTKFYVVP